jgi:hypothetical protein
MSMAIPSNYDWNLVTTGSNQITARNLCDVLPSRYFNNASVPTLKNTCEIAL